MIDYDTTWLDDALRRAALAADHADFPFVADIRGGIVKYLETKCPLKLLPLAVDCPLCEKSFGIGTTGTSVADPDPWNPYHFPGSGSVFEIRTRIHTCKYRIKWRQKMSDLRYYR